jgi:hypothetical protein
VNITGNAITAFRELQRKQHEELVADDLPHSKEIRRRLIDLVSGNRLQGILKGEVSLYYY